MESVVTEFLLFLFSRPLGKPMQKADEDPGWVPYLSFYCIFMYTSIGDIYFFICCH